MNQREIEAFALRDIAVALVEAKGTGIAPDMEAPPPPPCKPHERTVKKSRT